MTTGLRPAAPSAASHKKDERQMLPVREVATRLGVSRSTVMRAIEAREFPGVKFRGTWRVPRRFVDDFLTAAIHGRAIVLEEYAAEWSARNAVVAEAVPA